MANEFDIFNVSVKDLDTGERPSTGGSDYTHLNQIKDKTVYTDL